MKSLIAVIAVALLLGGCASQESYEAYRQSFDRAAEAYYLAATEPLVDITLPSPVKGEFYTIKVNREVEPMSPQQIKDSEWAPVATALIGTAGDVGLGFVLVDGVKDVVKTASNASGLHINNSDNAKVSGAVNKSSAGNHGTASAGDHHESTVEALGMHSDASLDQSQSNPVTSDDDVTTTVTRTDTRTNTETETNN